jgi:hypothetical protein
MENLKRLYLQNGSYELVEINEDSTGRWINVFDEDFLNYSIYKGRSATEQNIKLGSTTDVLKIWQLKIAIEIYEHFDQHWNYLAK